VAENGEADGRDRGELADVVIAVVLQPKHDAQNDLQPPFVSLTKSASPSCAASCPGDTRMEGWRGQDGQDGQDGRMDSLTERMEAAVGMNFFGGEPLNVGGGHAAV
jgi:hypothetical protein